VPIVVGGLVSLVAIADPTRAKLFPFTLAMLFSGTSVYVLALGLGHLGEMIFGPATASFILFVASLIIRGEGGANLILTEGIGSNRRISY
jgi:hypothetical protein